MYLASAAVNSLIQTLPSGSAYWIGMVLIVMMTGRLVADKGSLASAVFPFVMQMRWGWHRVERAMERGKLSLDALFDQLFEWCLSNLPVEPVRLGQRERELQAVDSSTIVRWRAGRGLRWIGKGYCHRAQRAVKANLVAAVTSVVLVSGKRLGIVRRIRFGSTCEEAVTQVMADAPIPKGKRLFVVDAGIAGYQQFSQATDRDALLGRLRCNCVLRSAPPPPTGRRGRPSQYGPLLHPGDDQPEQPPDEEYGVVDEAGQGVRVRRWNGRRHPQFPATLLDVVRVDDPEFRRPLIIGTTAHELTSQEMRLGYRCRWPVETNFYGLQDTTAMEMPRAWKEISVHRRIGLALLTGSLLQAIAARCEVIPTGPWDRQPTPSAGRLARFSNLHVLNFLALALHGVIPRNYRKIQDDCEINELDQELAA